jgi:hypothetical protein
MKKLFFPLFVVLISFSACAQENHLDQFYQKFNSGENSGSGNISFSGSGSFNISLLLNLSSDNAADTSWWHKITMCRFLTIDSGKAQNSQAWAALNQVLREDHFEEWMTVRHGKENFRLLSKDRKDGQEDVVCVAIDKNGSGVFFHLRGRFSADDKSRIGAALQDKNG